MYGFGGTYYDADINKQDSEGLKQGDAPYQGRPWMDGADFYDSSTAPISLDWNWSGAALAMEQSMDPPSTPEVVIAALGRW